MPAPIPSNVRSFLPYQWHQVAIYTDEPERAIEQYERLGYRNWVYDQADLIGNLEGEAVVTKAYMAFNYDIFPGELEFLRYIGPNRHQQEGRDGEVPFISHMSTYVDNVFLESTQIYKTFGMIPYHQFITGNNTNPAVKGLKRFIECIYDFRDLLGYDLKLIQKVPWDIPNHNAWTSFNVQIDYPHVELMEFSKPFTFESDAKQRFGDNRRILSDSPQA
jgi:hypothetical protein